MDKKQAQALIKETFEKPFDKAKFTGFVKNLLNTIQEDTFTYRGNYIPDAYEQYINTLERIGKYSVGEHKIDILIAKLKKESSIERARTMQRNFIAWYLNGSRGGELKDAALVAFVAPNEEDWRFSLVKMDYRFEEGKNGRLKVKEDFTPARRWSFLVGVNEKSHTAQKQLVDIVIDDENNPTLARLENAFNIETVTKEFFEAYRELFLWGKETLDNVVKKDRKIKTDFESKGVNTVDFSKKLLGQIVFLYFLQKKGWFGVKRDSSWGTGPKNFLRELFESKHGTYNNFFNDILEPLFYEALAREREDDFYSRFNCKIPFLNGGLFDPLNNYDWVHTDILLPNEIFSNSFKTKEGDNGNGILDIFDRYNFTVKEDEPLEKEVAIDPELLGKAYEKFNAIRSDNYEEYKKALKSGQKGAESKFNKQYGVYYTPREIVHYMCQQSLINYLFTALEKIVTKNDIETLIRHGESVREIEALVMAKGKETETYYHKLPESIRINAELIDEKLANIKVCDPAIGSGAFPVGMMSEIFRARNTLSNYINDKNRTIYNFKRDCIQNSLYGVDIDPGAVEIAKLRLWLSLVVDEEDIKQIKPLPNLDYKIMQGNSLLEEYEGIKLFDEKIIATVDVSKEKTIENLKAKQAKLSAEYISLHQSNNLPHAKRIEIDEELKRVTNELKRITKPEIPKEGNLDLFSLFSESKQKADALRQLHKEFFETSQKKKKDELKERIEKIEWELIEATLLEQRKTHELIKLQELKNINVKPYFLWPLHFSEVFEEKGGFDVVIANPPYGADIDQMVDVYAKLYPSTTKSFKDIYKIFIEMGLTKLIHNTGGVLCYIIPNTLLLQPRYKDVRQFLLQYRISEILNLGEGVFEQVVVPTCVILVQSQAAEKNIVRFADLTDKSKFSGGLNFINHAFVDQNQYESAPGFIFVFDTRAIKPDELHLGEVLQMKDAGINYQRVHVGLSDKGNSDLSDRLLYEGKKINQSDEEYWKGSDISSYYIAKKTNRYVRTNIKLKSNERVILNRDYFSIKPKLLWRQTAEFPIVALDTKGVWFGRSIQAGVITDTKSFDYGYLLALLNSKYLRYLYSEIVKESGRVFPQVKLEKIKLLPIKKLPLAEQERFTEIVDKIMSITHDKDYLQCQQKQSEASEYEHRIDYMVYKLYELKKEEIKIVEDM